MSRLVFLDTETTGLPKSRNSNGLEIKGNWPDIVSVAWAVYENKTLVKSRYSVIKPEGWTIPADSIRIHGITEEEASKGSSLHDILTELGKDLEDSTVVAHNMEFDKNVLLAAYKWRLGINPWTLWPKTEICTMVRSTSELKLPSRFKDSKQFKPPTLTELYKATFGKEPVGQHNSQKDVEILCEIYWSRWP